LVRATVRSLKDTSKYEYLSRLFPQVEVVEGELEKEGSYDAAVQGVKVIFHCASAGGLKDPGQIVDQTINTTMNVLRSAEKEKSVQRVVFTTSCGTASSFNKDDNYVFSEKDWNEDTSLTNRPSQYGKTLAEKAAIEFAKDKHFDLVVVLPNGVIGTPLTARLETSIHVLKSIVDGSAVKAGGIIAYAFAVVTVADVALAHVLAAEKKAAHGRYIIAGKDSISLLEIAGLVKSSGKFDPANIPTTELRGPPKRAKFDASKAERELGLHLHTLSEVKEDILKVFDFFVSYGAVKAL